MNMIEITKDKKSNDIWIITRTDNEGFHRQLAVTKNELKELVIDISKVIDHDGQKYNV